MKKEYYVIEVQNVQSWKNRADFTCTCMDLKHAKRQALRYKSFQGTVLKVYSDSNLLNLLAIYHNGWEEV